MGNLYHKKIFFIILTLRASDIFCFRHGCCRCCSLSQAKREVKSVQSALRDLVTTSATHDTFSRPSTKRGLILIGLEQNTNARESFEHC